jgi:tetratricopeptide (TPR) repeat protein
VIIVACSTEKDAWANRTYHNVTAHYNGYWNAQELIKETMDAFEGGYAENYDEILPVFVYPNEEESKNFKSPMDTAIKKCETVIFKHQMPEKKVGQFKRTEWCAWIDDNWFVIGESQFYKRDFNKSLKKFEFIEKQYPTEEIIYNARLWQAKIYMEQENFPAAKSILDELQEEMDEQAAAKEEKTKKEKPEKKKKSKYKSKKRKKSSSSSKKKEEEKGPPEFTEDFEREYYPVLADYYLRKKEYGKAEEALLKSIELVKDRQFKTRLIFILAQIKHKQNNPEASELYAEVVKRNPKYDMAFVAKINKAIAFSGDDRNKVKAELKKMIKDDKNKDYLDQIYYALGDLELQDGNKPDGINYLELSVQSSTSNPKQKSKSFLRLGKLYYEGKNYIKAQKYYDSTLSVLDQDHPEYELIEFQNVSLTELVTHLNTADHQDSLLSLCELSETELNKKIQGQIDDLVAQRQAEEEAAAAAALTPTAGGNLAAKGDFWAFNEKLRNSGFDKFKGVWGVRPNEDNWRRADKSVVFSDETTDGNGEEKEDPLLTIEHYKKDLPCGKPTKEKKAQEDVINGYYNAATIYKQKLSDPDGAKKTFQKLEKYLPHRLSIESLFQVYLIEKEAGNTTGINKYKDWILNDYPDSEYAKLIKNPNYAEELNNATKAEEIEYEKIYNKFITKDYAGAIKDIDERLKVKDNPLECKYLYMKAMAIGYSNTNPEDLTPIETALEDVIANCDDEDIVAQSQATLDKLRNVQSVIDAKTGASTYIYDKDAKHFFVLVFPNSAGSVNQAKSKVSDLNIASFSTKNLETKSSFIDENNQLIIVKPFANKEAAMDYYLTFKVNDKQVKKLKEFDYFVISDKNFSALFLEKNIEAYINFFTKNYLKK